VAAFSLAAGIPLAIYFLMGVIVGRMSSGRTIREPAVSALIGLLVVAALQYLAGMVNVFGIVFGAPFCFGLAYLGGWVGERWQSRARRTS
jgi:hypothetical protein